MVVLVSYRFRQGWLNLGTSTLHFIIMMTRKEMMEKGSGLFIFVYVCVSVCLSVYLSVSVYLYICLTVSLSVSLSVSISVFVSLSVSLTVCMAVWLYFCVSRSACTLQEWFDISIAEGFAARVEVGAGHNCVLKQNGKVACWGLNNYGQLGIGTNMSIGRSAHDMGDALEDANLGFGKFARWKQRFSEQFEISFKNTLNRTICM